MSEKSARLPQLAGAAVAVVVAAVLLFVGHSWGEAQRDDDRPVGIEAAAQRASATGHNAQDLMFTKMMVPHHEQATAMAELAAARAQSSDVKALADKIAGAQTPEIEKMKGWLSFWDATSMGSMGSMKDGAMTGMMSESDMAALAKASGTRFDAMFLRMMVEHHRGAITMADQELTKGKSADALALAASIVVSQQAEVAQMKDMMN